MIGGYRNQGEYNKCNPQDSAIGWFVFAAALVAIIFMVIL